MAAPVVVPFEFAHLDLLDVQDCQAKAKASMCGLPETADVERMSSYTMLDGDRALACGGVFEISPWRGFAWVLIAKNIGHNFILLHRVTMRLLAAVPYARIENEIDYEFEAGHRWARIMGFEVETERVRKYREDGGDITRYVMVR